MMAFHLGYFIQFQFNFDFHTLKFKALLLVRSFTFPIVPDMTASTCIVFCNIQSLVYMFSNVYFNVHIS